MDKLKVFMIMPFKDEFLQLYESLKKDLGDEYEFSNAGEEGNQQNILRDIISPLYHADVVIADLTGLNPNVMYELGVAHTFEKKTIVITQDELSTLPFDLKQYRAKGYTTHFSDITELVDYLKTNLEDVTNGTGEYSNPVIDFSPAKKIESKAIVTEIPAVPENIETETDIGFLNAVADLEMNITTFMNELQTMNKTIEEFYDNKEYISLRLEKRIMNIYPTINDYIEKITSLWNKIENGISYLFENKFVSDSKNRNYLIANLKFLYKSQEIINISKKYILIFDNIYTSNNKNILELIQAYIKNIFIKAKYIIGDIDFSAE